MSNSRVSSEFCSYYAILTTGMAVLQPERKPGFIVPELAANVILGARSIVKYIYRNGTKAEFPTLRNSGLVSNVDKWGRDYIGAHLLATTKGKQDFSRQ